jgi:DNA-binding beta-propeller fold protein YncE
MSVVDVTSHKIVRTFGAPAWFNVFYEQSRDELYYLRGDTREVRVADRQDGHTLTTLTLAGRPSFLEGDPSHHRVLVRLQDKPMIQIIDTVDRSIVASWPARADGESAMAVAPDGSRVFVSSGRDVLMLDGETGKELGKFGTGDTTHSIVFDPSTHLVAALSGAGRVNVARMDATGVKLVQSLDTRAVLHELLLDPKSHKIFGITRLFDDGIMRDFVSQSMPPDGGSTLLTLTLDK